MTDADLYQRGIETLIAAWQAYARLGAIPSVPWRRWAHTCPSVFAQDRDFQVEVEYAKASPRSRDHARRVSLSAETRCPGSIGCLSSSARARSRIPVC
jgi:hypothetical protein